MHQALFVQLEEDRYEVYPCSMRIFKAIAASALIGTALIVTKPAEAQTFMCAPYGDDTMIPCQVFVDGNKVSVGGFQAAPVFKMQSSWKAVNHRGDIVKVMKGKNYTMFLNTATNSSLRIYGFLY